MYFKILFTYTNFLMIISENKSKDFQFFSKISCR